MARRLTIGELSRRTGLPVKTLRFYSDEGLLPPAERTASGYRLYSEDQVVRLELIRTLREAGVGLETIRRVLRRDVTLEEALRLRLGAIEAHIASLRRVAAAIRAAIRSGASEEDLRRLSMVTKLSKDERRKVIASFFAKVMDGLPAANEWVKNMIEASVPDLPDEPSPEQIDAWIELSKMLEDASFVDNMRAQATEFWAKDVDLAALQRSQAEFHRVASDARARGVDPTSEEAWTLIRGLIAKMASAVGLDEAAMTERMRKQYDRRAERYWELVAIMRGAPTPQGRDADYQWLGAAMRHHLAS